MAAKKKIDLTKQYSVQQQNNNKITIGQQQDSGHSKYARYMEEESKTHQEPVVKNEPKKINMAFSDQLYAMIREESEKLGIPMSGFVNCVIKSTTDEQIKDTYDKQLVKASKDLIPRKRGNAAKRIFIKFEPEVYKKIVDGAEIYNQTLTQYVNLVLSAATR